MSITAIAGFSETLLSGLSQTPTVQLLEKYAAQVTLAVLFKQTSFEVGGCTVTVKQNSGTPQAITLGAAFQAVENIELGQMGSFTSGSLEVDVQKTAA
jgi:hypothetical protein